MKKLLLILLCLPLLFSTCKKEEESPNNNTIDNRNEIVGQYDASYSMNIINLIDTIPSGGPNSGEITVVKLGTSNISLTLKEFGPGGEDVTFSCNMLAQVSGGLTFEIIETTDITMSNLDLNGPGPDWTLYGVNGPQTYSLVNSELQVSFEMENGHYMIEMDLIAIKTN